MKGGREDVDGVRTLNNEPQKKMAENRMEHKELMKTIKLDRMKAKMKRLLIKDDDDSGEQYQKRPHSSEK
jgi:hypothetical protein